MSSKIHLANKPSRKMPTIREKLPLRKKERIALLTGDILTILPKLSEKSVNLILTSPPYNIEKEYETKATLVEYLENIKKVVQAITRVLADDGSICWQVGSYVSNGEVFPLDIYHYDIFKEQGYKLRNRIVWHFGHGLHAYNRFSGRYEMMLWFTKSDNYTFNLNDVRIPSKYPGKRHYRGDKKGQLSGNPLGKNPSDVWTIIAQEWEDGFWDIPNVRAKHREKTEHPCQFPIEVAERCILALSKEDDLILDPFCGVGSSVLAALMHERRAIGIEKEARYVETARERVNLLFEGKLPYRQIGTPVHQPKGTEKVVRVPEEWANDSIYSNGQTSNGSREIVAVQQEHNRSLENSVDHGNNHRLHSLNGAAVMFTEEATTPSFSDFEEEIIAEMPAEE